MLLAVQPAAQLATKEVFERLRPSPVLKQAEPRSLEALPHTQLSHEVCNSVVTALITPEVCDVPPSRRQAEPVCEEYDSVAPSRCAPIDVPLQ